MAHGVNANLARRWIFDASDARDRVPVQEDRAVEMTSPRIPDFSKLEVGLLSGSVEGAQGEAMKRSRFSEVGIPAHRDHSFRAIVTEHSDPT
jgi:hypothetical protein